jgi:hypothetical protein
MATLGANSAATPSGPPPSTAAGGANGAGRGVVLPPPLNASAEAPARAPQRREGPPDGPPAGPPEFHDPVPPSRPQFSRLAVIAASIVAVVVVIVAVVVLINRGSGSPQNAGSSVTSNASSPKSARRPRHHTTALVTPSSVTVAVLNGTSTSHLAADVMAKLTSKGFKPGATPTNAPAQTVTSTIVGYAQPAFRADALAVAKSLKLGSASVQGVTAGDRAAACHGATTGCSAQVVVTVGSDLASTASASSTG